MAKAQPTSCMRNRPPDQSATEHAASAGHEARREPKRHFQAMNVASAAAAATPHEGTQNSHSLHSQRSRNNWPAA
jgi:hypothetical protein